MIFFDLIRLIAFLGVVALTLAAVIDILFVGGKKSKQARVPKKTRLGDAKRA